MTTSNKLLNYTLSVTLVSTILTAAAPLAATFVDGVIVGNMLGAEAFNAINVTMPISNLITVLTLICSMGGSVLAAKALATKEIDLARKIFTISIFSALAVALLCVVLIYAFIDEFVGFLCPDAASAVFLKDYLTVLLLYFIFVPLNSTLNNFVSQEGYPNLTTKIVLTTNVINILLDIVFINYMDMGIKGAAWATVISGALNALAYYPHFLQSRSHYKLVALQTEDLDILKKTFVQGVAFNVFYIMINGLVFFVNKLVFGLLGTEGMQIYGVCLQIQSFTFCIAIGTAIAGIAQVNRLLAGHISNKVAYVINKLLQFTTLFFTGLLIVMILIPETVASLFGISNQEVLGSCRIPFLCFSAFYLCYAIMAVYSTISFQLMGHVKAKFIFIFGLGIVVYMFMFGFSCISPELLWWGFPVGGVIMLAASFLYGFINHKKHPTFTRFTLVEKMPTQILLSDTLDYECKKLPELMQKLRLFTEICELPESVFKGIELCCTEYCEYLQNSRMPSAAKTFDVSLRQIPEGIVLIIESAGAPNSILLDNAEREKMIANNENLTQSEIRALILSGIPTKLEYRYMFGLNVTSMTWYTQSMTDNSVTNR